MTMTMTIALSGPQSKRAKHFEPLNVSMGLGSSQDSSKFYCPYDMNRLVVGDVNRFSLRVPSVKPSVVPTAQYGIETGTGISTGLTPRSQISV